MSDSDRHRPAVGPVALADALGWGSSLLGAPMTLAPRRFVQAIGIRPDRRTVSLALVVGIREHAATLNILAMRQRRIGMWSRVAGDVMDLSLLAAAFLHRRQDERRLVAAGTVVAGLLAADLVTAVQLTRADGAHVSDGQDSVGVGAPPRDDGGAFKVETAVTIRATEAAVRAAFDAFPWSAFDASALKAANGVRVTAAPGDRGVEVHVDHDPPVYGGALGAWAAKALGRAPDQKINDDLRRFKAQVETGVTVRSDKTPEGPSVRRQIKQRPAQPVRVAS
jgi:hypothetical protein